MCYLKSNPSGLSCCFPSSSDRFQCPGFSPVCCPAAGWVVRGVCAVQTSSAWGRDRGACIAGTHRACFGTENSPGYGSSQSLASPVEAGKGPGMTEGVLNSSSDYSFCESGCVCINWTWLLATGFPAHNHGALTDFQLCHYRNYYGDSISALLQTHSGWGSQCVIMLRE